MMSVTIDQDARFDSKISSARPTGRAGRRRACAGSVAVRTYMDRHRIHMDRHRILPTPVTFGAAGVPAGASFPAPSSGISFTRAQEPFAAERASRLPGKESLKCAIHAITRIREEQRS